MNSGELGTCLSMVAAEVTRRTPTVAADVRRRNPGCWIVPGSASLPRRLRVCGILRPALNRDDAVGQASSLSHRPMGRGFGPVVQPLDLPHQTVGDRWSFGDRLEACPTWVNAGSRRASTTSSRIELQKGRQP